MDIPFRVAIEGMLTTLRAHPRIDVLDVKFGSPADPEDIEIADC